MPGLPGPAAHAEARTLDGAFPAVHITRHQRSNISTGRRSRCMAVKRLASCNLLVVFTEYI